MAVQCIKLPGAKELGVVSSSVSTLSTVTESLKDDIAKLEKESKALKGVHRKSNWQGALRCGRR